MKKRIPFLTNNDHSDKSYAGREYSTEGYSVKSNWPISLPSGRPAVTMTGDLLSLLSHLERQRGRYVYAWFKDQDKVPFYIGVGSGLRCLTLHTVDNGTKLARCELARQSAQTFTIRILRCDQDGVDVVAYEQHLIYRGRRRGWPLTNATRHLTLEQLLLKYPRCYREKNHVSA